MVPPVRQNPHAPKAGKVPAGDTAPGIPANQPRPVVVMQHPSDGRPAPRQAPRRDAARRGPIPVVQAPGAKSDPSREATLDKLAKRFKEMEIPDILKHVRAVPDRSTDTFCSALVEGFSRQGLREKANEFLKALIAEKIGYGPLTQAAALDLHREMGLDQIFNAQDTDSLKPVG